MEENNAPPFPTKVRESYERPQPFGALLPERRPRERLTAEALLAHGSELSRGGIDEVTRRAVYLFARSCEISVKILAGVP